MGGWGVIAGEEVCVGCYSRGRGVGGWGVIGGEEVCVCAGGV